jgi:hypothetical protein
MQCIAFLCLQVALGLSHANPQDCGIWYTCGPQYPNAFGLNSPSLALGVESRVWRAGVEYTGRFWNRGYAPDTSDPAAIACAPRCYPVSTWIGAGKVFGVYAQYVARLPHGFSLEAGPWLYRATWNELVPDAVDMNHRNLPPCVFRDEGHSTSWGAMVGASYALDDANSVALSVRSAADHGAQPSIVKGFVSNLSLRHSW